MFRFCRHTTTTENKPFFFNSHNHMNKVTLLRSCRCFSVLASPKPPRRRKKAENFYNQKEEPYYNNNSMAPRGSPSRPKKVRLGYNGQRQPQQPEACCRGSHVGIAMFVVLAQLLLYLVVFGDKSGSEVVRLDRDTIRNYQTLKDQKLKMTQQQQQQPFQQQAKGTNSLRSIPVPPTDASDEDESSEGGRNEEDSESEDGRDKGEGDDAEGSNEENNEATEDVNEESAAVRKDGAGDKAKVVHDKKEEEIEKEKESDDEKKSGDEEESEDEKKSGDEEDSGDEKEDEEENKDNE